MKKIIFLHPTILLLAACDNPGGISDAEYAKYTELGAPKILYSCTVSSVTTLPGLKAMNASVQAMKACLETKDLEKAKECVEKNRYEDIPIINVGYKAGIGGNITYNKILTEAKDECSGEFKILESEQ